jgi:pyridoxamine 5'-phosphate oxidase
MVKRDLSALRQEYAAASLEEHSVNPDPLLQFAAWFDQALEAGLPEPNAMTLATMGPGGMPNARVVLLKELDERGFVFYTNYQSWKGKELENNPLASLVFLWLELHRQVRIRGWTEKLSERESDTYFLSRPRESQLGAMASPQSEVVPGREFLEARFRELEEKYRGKPLVRPAHWGGYRLFPESIEFWQGRTGRLHDRLLYIGKPGFWKLQRLAP